jgi:hypothetical protein
MLLAINSGFAANTGTPTACDQPPSRLTFWPAGDDFTGAGYSNHIATQSGSMGSESESEWSALHQ